MSEQEIRKTFSRLLKYHMELNGKTQVDIVNDLKIPFSTMSSWVNGIKMPRMGKIELLAAYLGVEKSNLLEDNKDEATYYLNDDSKEVLKALQVNPKLRILFDATSKLEPSDIDYVLALIERLKKEERQ